MLSGFAARSSVCRLLTCALMMAVWLLATSTAEAQTASLFAQPTVIATGNWPAAVYSADMNGDGVPDLVYLDQGATAAASTTHVLLNDGKGHFTQSAVVQTAGTSIAIGNFMNDGRMSLGWLSFNPSDLLTTMYVAPANGSGGFGSDQTFSQALGNAQTQYVNLTAAQIHATGAANIVALDAATSTLYRFRLSLGFVNVSSVGPALPDGVGPITAVDVNNDGFIDLIVNGQSGSAADVYLGDGTGNLAPARRFTGVNGIRSLLAKDVNGDKIPDLIAEGTAGHLDVFLGDGDGTFSSTSIGGTGTLDGTTGNGGHLIVSADLNHDGQLDALTATPIGVSALLGQGTAYLGLKGIYNAGPGMHSFATADFNGDGNLDIATDSPEGIAILYGNADGSFQSGQAFAAGQPAVNGAVGVFTSSGQVDAVVATAPTQAQLLRGQGDGTFVFQAAAGAPDLPVPTTAQTGTKGYWSGIAVADFNGDGLLDLAMTQDGGSQASNGGVLLPTDGLSQGVDLQFGNGDGTFQPPTVEMQFYKPAPGQTNPLYGVSAEADLLGPGAGGLATISSWGAMDYRPMQALPYPGAGPPHNLPITGRLGNPADTTLVLQHNGSLFVAPTVNGFSSIVTYAKDLAVDGSLTTPGQMVAPDISPTFPGPSKALGFDAFPGSGFIADMDGDGYGDLLVAYDNLDANHAAPTGAHPNYLYIWFGSSDGAFRTSTAHPVNPVRLQLSRNYYQVKVADLNGDGIPDLVLSDGYLISVQYGTGNGGFGPETHYLAGQGLNSISVADLRHKGVLDLVVANGGTVFGNAVANKEVLTPNPDVSTGGVTVLLNGLSAKASASTLTGTLIAAPEPSAFQAAYTLTATLTAPNGGAAPTGTVTFSADGTSAGSATVANGSASVPGPVTLLPGVHTLSASYSGDANNPALTLTGSHTVLLAPTSVVLTATTPLTTQYGGPANGTFMVVLTSVGYPATGTYTVLDNGNAVAICTNLPLTVNGVPVNCPYGDPVLLDAGVHAFQVRYNGDPINAPSTSAAVVYTILPDPTTVRLVSSVNPANLGQAVSFTATVTGTLAVPTGTVQILDGTAVIGAVVLNSGSASFTTSVLTPGVHSITAAYGATLDFNASASAPLVETIMKPVQPLASLIALTSSINPAPQGTNVVFTATVQAPGPFLQVPTGIVSFLDGTAVIGTGVLNQQGIASFTLSTLAVGSHAITASYGGDAAHGISTTKPTPLPPVVGTPRAAAPGATGAKGATPSSQGTLPSISAVLTEVIVPPLAVVPTGFALTVSPDPLSINAGGTAVLLVTVRAVSGYAEPVALSCAGNTMSESACQFVLGTIPAGGGATTLQISTMSPHDCGDPQPYGIGRNGSPLLPLGVSSAALLGCMFLRRRRRWSALLMLIALCGLAAVSGCGHCTDLGTKPGSYSVMVVGTGADGLVQSVKLPVTVTFP